MNIINKLIELYNSPIYPAAITFLFVLSEVIGESEKLKSSSIYGVIKSGLAYLKSKLPGQSQP